MKVGIVGGGEGWHRYKLEEAFAKRGVMAEHYPITQLTAGVGTDPGEVSFRGKSLKDCQALVVRTIPGGSLEQIIFRMNMLHRLEQQGVSVCNPPGAIEKTVDKYYTSSLLAAAGLPTPATLVTESYQGALEAFEKLGGDVVVKPLFGSLGKGIVRVEDRDVAHRVFRALELGNYVFYLQQYIPHHNRDIRAFVLGGAVVAAMTRESESWKTNIALGATAASYKLTPEEEEVALAAAAAVGAHYAGVDLLRSRDGQLYVLEVNGIPGWQGLQGVSSLDIAGEIAQFVLRGRGAL